MDEWKPVSETPKYPGDKHLIFDGHEIYVGWLISGFWHVCKDGVTIDGDATFGVDDLYGSVTHWAPLPSAPVQ